jgi:GTP cyclohydrolase I
LKLISANHSRVLSTEEKKAMIEKATKEYGELLTTLGFDWQHDPNMKDTPARVIKAWVNELICGCYDSPPKITAFENVDHYDGMVFSGDIDVISLCCHHWLSFIGKAYISYIPTKKGKVIGLSKLNRIVEYFSRRPQIQENLTMQIHNYVNEVCVDNLGVAVHIKARHACVCNRGVKHNSVMKTTKLSGVFLDNNNLAREEFYNFIG